MEKIAKRTVSLRREAEGIYIATNAAGAELRFGPNAEGGFGNVELLLAAVAGCSGTDLDVMTCRRAEPTRWGATVTADKVSTDGATILRDIVVTFHVEFPEGDDGDKARARVAPALKSAHEKTCTISRTIELGSKVTLQAD